MPQMAPYNWLLLNFLFSLMFLMYIILLNFILVKKYPSMKDNKNMTFSIKW